MERCLPTDRSERAAARVAELRAVLQSTHSLDVQDALKAAIADLEERYELGSRFPSQRSRPQFFPDLELFEPWHPSSVDPTATPYGHSRWTCSERT